jgi:hypothetical protein
MTSSEGAIDEGGVGMGAQDAGVAYSPHKHTKNQLVELQDNAHTSDPPPLPNYKLSHCCRAFDRARGGGTGITSET